MLVWSVGIPLQDGCIPEFQLTQEIFVSMVKWKVTLISCRIKKTIKHAQIFSHLVISHKYKHWLTVYQLYQKYLFRSRRHTQALHIYKKSRTQGNRICIARSSEAISMLAMVGEVGVGAAVQSRKHFLPLSLTWHFDYTLLSISLLWTIFAFGSNKHE